MPRWLARTLLIVLAIFAIGVGIYLFLPRTPRFTVEQFDQIHNGMTQTEVEAVLGSPPGGHIPKDLIDRLPEPDAEPSGTLHQWVADDQHQIQKRPGAADAIAIWVWFDADGRVMRKHRHLFLYFPPTLLERLREWVGW